MLVLCCVTPRCVCASQVDYMRQAVSYLNHEPAIERYAWFTTRWYLVSSSLTAPTLLTACI